MKSIEKCICDNTRVLLEWRRDFLIEEVDRLEKSHSKKYVRMCAKLEEINYLLSKFKPKVRIM